MERMHPTPESTGGTYEPPEHLLVGDFRRLPGEGDIERLHAADIVADAFGGAPDPGLVQDVYGELARKREALALIQAQGADIPASVSSGAAAYFQARIRAILYPDADAGSINKDNTPGAPQG